MGRSDEEGEVAAEAAVDEGEVDDVDIDEDGEVV